VVEDDRVAALVANFESWLPVFASFPDAKTDERYGVHTWTSSVRAPFFNGLLGAPPPEVIDELLAPFEAESIPVVWAVTPPGDISSELELRGFGVESLPGMTVELAALPELALPTGVEVLPVDDDPELLEVATELAFTTNGFPPGMSKPIMHALGRMPGRDRFATFLATMDGEPAAASALLVSGKVAGLFNVGTLPAFRRRGLGSAVSLAALHAGRAIGCTLGALQSSAEAIGVYRGLGFEECCRVVLAFRG
jgi:hypothetical protein